MNSSTTIPDTFSDTSTEPETIDFFHPSPKTSLLQLNSKLKRSLCRNYTQKGFCPYGSKCQFAHGLEELKCNKTQNSLYKTKVCYSFQKKGSCMYGVRCNFIHKNEEEYAEEKQEKMNKGYREVLYGGKGAQESKLLKVLKNGY